MELHALVVGCGRIGGGYNRGPGDTLVLTHALAYTRHDAFTLAAAVDPDPDTRAEFAKRWDVAATYATLHEALEAADYDVASVCSSTATHGAVLEHLLDAGTPRVFAEKPLGGDPRAARAIARRFADEDRALAVNFLRRWDPSMAALRDEIAQGRWGALRSAVGWYGRGIRNNGSHMLDLIAFLTGHTPSRPRPFDRRDDGVADDPTVSAVFDIDGVPFALIGEDGRDHARFELTLSFSDGVVEILQGGLSLRRRSVVASDLFADTRIVDIGDEEPTGYGTAFLHALDELAAWTPNDRLASDAETALPAIALADEVAGLVTEPTS